MYIIEQFKTHILSKFEQIWIILNRVIVKLLNRTFYAPVSISQEQVFQTASNLFSYIFDLHQTFFITMPIFKKILTENFFLLLESSSLL
ncbi:hypothetical protein B9Z55_019210 [Caenorhabditis nigoni]|uniref:Uncharacterized protein n=1 Tax=Caenorhabditis nigoni TaxID=1611254 RepID=A0A2G5TI75_9PELO|nr:hypothetical protein B9Z55_019209 [Caenorhabditis nigoni]PIC26716.1 hypothetical protein B9Z55_019210 [Caenorhabditis nigoni]